VPKRNNYYNQAEDGAKGRVADYTLAIYTRHVKDKGYETDFIPKVGNVDEMEQSYIGYLKNCSLYDKLPSAESAFHWLGLNKAIVSRWKKGNVPDPKIFEFIYTLQSSLATALEDAGNSNAVDLIWAMFQGKTHLGWVEEQHKTVTIEYTGAVVQKFTEEERQAIIDGCAIDQPLMIEPPSVEIVDG